MNKPVLAPVLRVALTAAVGALVFSQAARASETGAARTPGVPAQSEGIYQLQNLNTGSCGEYYNGELIGLASPDKCADRRAGPVKVRNDDSYRVRVHQADNLALTPNMYEPLRFPPATKAIVIESKKEMSFKNRFQSKAPGKGCAFNMAEEIQSAKMIGPERTLLLDRYDDNVTTYPWYRFAPNKRSWIVRDEATGQHIGQFICDTKVGDDPEKMTRLLRRWWSVQPNLE